ncbi:MAG: enoyl-CoA hydratase-related protein [Bdellovibrionota bacterium]
MDFENLKVHGEGGIWTAAISRPEAMNALNSSVLDSISKLLDAVHADHSVRAVILTGIGEKAFVAGADIKQFESFSPSSAANFASAGQALFTRIETLRVPVIAAVNGFALGGGLELALSCDFIIASENAKFGLPECTLGLMPGYGGTVRLPRRVGASYAREMALTGNMIDSAEALRIGLVNRVTAQPELLSTCRTLAGTIASRAPLAIAAIKKSIHEGASLTEAKASDLEAKLFGELFASSDKTEGVRAFIEKRKPAFTGQ